MFVTFNVVYPIIFSPVYFLNVKLPARYIAIFCVSSNMFNDEWDDDRVSKPTFYIYTLYVCTVFALEVKAREMNSTEYRGKLCIYFQVSVFYHRIFFFFNLTEKLSFFYQL